MSEWIDITEILTDEGKEAISVGTILRFEKAELRIMRKSKDGKIWAKEVETFLPEQVTVNGDDEALNDPKMQAFAQATYEAQVKSLENKKQV